MNNESIEQVIFCSITGYQSDPNKFYPETNGWKHMDLKLLIDQIIGWSHNFYQVTLNESQITIILCSLILWKSSYLNDERRKTIYNKLNITKNWEN
jgi:hypothetical protein